AAELHAGKHVAVGDAGGRKQHVTARHLLGAVDLVGVGDAHLGRARDLFRRIEQQASLDLAAGAAQGGGSQHAFRRTAGAHVDVDACLFRVGGVDDAGNVAVADEADGSTGA